MMEGDERLDNAQSESGSSKENEPLSERVMEVTENG